MSEFILDKESGLFFSSAPINIASLKLDKQQLEEIFKLGEQVKVETEANEKTK